MDSSSTLLPISGCTVSRSTQKRLMSCMAVLLLNYMRYHLCCSHSSLYCRHLSHLEKLVKRGCSQLYKTPESCWKMQMSLWVFRFTVFLLPPLEINKHLSIFLQASRIFGMRWGLFCALFCACLEGCTPRDKEQIDKLSKLICAYIFKYGTKTHTVWHWCQMPLIVRCVVTDQYVPVCVSRNVTEIQVNITRRIKFVFCLIEMRTLSCFWVCWEASALLVLLKESEGVAEAYF